MKCMSWIQSGSKMNKAGNEDLDRYLSNAHPISFVNTLFFGFHFSVSPIQIPAERESNI